MVPLKDIRFRFLKFGSLEEALRGPCTRGMFLEGVARASRVVTQEYLLSPSFNPGIQRLEGIQGEPFRQPCLVNRRDQPTRSMTLLCSPCFALLRSVLVVELCIVMYGDFYVR